MVLELENPDYGLDRVYTTMIVITIVWHVSTAYVWIPSIVKLIRRLDGNHNDILFLDDIQSHAIVALKNWASVTHRISDLAPYSSFQIMYKGGNSTRNIEASLPRVINIGTVTRAAVNNPAE